MSFPQRFDSNRFENAQGSNANNCTQMPNSNFQGPYDSFQAQSYGRIPAPVTYPNPPIRPTNMFFPPMDFSVPPPNFTQMNVSATNRNKQDIVIIL